MTPAKIPAPAARPPTVAACAVPEYTSMLIRDASSTERPASRPIRPNVIAQAKTAKPMGRARRKPRRNPSAVKRAVKRTLSGLARSGLTLVSDDLLALLAQALDSQRHHVTGLEEHRVGLHAEADAGRRARANHVTRQ